MRVFELARKLDMSSKDLISDLAEIEIEVPNHMTTLTDDQLALALKEFSGEVPPEPESAPVVEELTADEQALVEEAPVPVEEQEPPVPQPEAEVEAPSDSLAEAETAEEVPAEEEEEADEHTIFLKGKSIAVRELASMLGLKPNILIAELMRLNVFAAINQELDVAVARKVAEGHGFTVEKARKKKEAPPLEPQPETPAAVDKATRPGKKKKQKKGGRLPDHDDAPDQMVPRAPVVTFMGHVDHGKTSLLDKIRSTRVVDGESGGITQHIGAYSVELEEKSITFLDTPGHAAFTSMRARGAMLTDIVVLVVAADDGVMPQTREAAQHALAAGVTLIVAVNKMDLPGANPDRVLDQLLALEIVTEGKYGGEVGVCYVSAETGEGIGELLERISLDAEMKELSANPNCSAEGYVIEARLEPGMGPTATVLIKRGTLKIGDAMVCGSSWGRIKSLINDKNIHVRTAGPSDAVKCLGLTSVPEAGAAFTIAPNDKAARAAAEKIAAENRKEDLQSATRPGATLDDLLANVKGASRKVLNLVVKTDVQGTLEAVEQSLADIQSDKVDLKIVLSGVGAITENDVLLAKASNAIIVGFHVSKATGVDSIAKHEGVEIRLYSVIYELFDQVRAAMTGLLDPVFREQVQGHAEIRQVFEIGRRDRIAGCMVIDGRVSSRSKVRVKRAGSIMYEGTISSLKRFQNDASEVRDGQECGIALDNYRDIAAGDILEFYVLERLEQQL